MSTADAGRIGSEVRDRRVQLGLSVRALAARASISPAYVTAIETANNPSTRRPPALGLAVAQRLAAALELDVALLIKSPGARAEHGRHVLAHVAAEPPGGMIAILDQLYGAEVDHWFHILDPRRPDTPSPRVTPCRFPLGDAPYATPELDRDALLSAVDRRVAKLPKRLHGARIGMLIEDCSAVMRYLQDAVEEVAMEASWHDEVTRIWADQLGTTPAIDVCGYRADDLAAMGLTIDQLQTALDLIEHHDDVLLIDGHETLYGAPAIRRILAAARPSGASATAWEQLATAASRTLASANDRGHRSGDAAAAPAS